jgi:hypothetical protein
MRKSKGMQVQAYAVGSALRDEPLGKLGFTCKPTAQLTTPHGFPHLAFQMWNELKPGIRRPETERGLLETTKTCQIAPDKLLSLNQD